MGVWVGETVMVGERVAVCEAVGVRVPASVVEVAVAGTGRVAVGRRMAGVGVAVVTTSGISTNVDRIASRNPIPRMTGMAYLRSMSGKAAPVVTGTFPEYPIASSRFLRFAA